MTATAAPIPVRRTELDPRSGRLAATTYVAAWVVGLTAFGAGVASDATGSEVVAHYTDHRIATALQSVLVHGVAAAALLAVLVTMARRGGGTRMSHLAGVVGVALSGVQLLLGLWRSLAASGSMITTLVDVIDRIDGIKLAAFSVMIGAALPALQRAGWIGPRMRMVGVAAAGTLGVAAAAYLSAVEPLLVAAGPALVLLVVWIARLGVVADRHQS